MIKKKPDKKIPEIEPLFGTVLVCNDRKLKPFIETLIQEPENIAGQNLGTLIGVFEVTDRGEDSSYIVNYLISIIKKEYFSKPKRGPIESLEAALHKANLALSKLTEHGSVGWLGKLNALVAVMEKNNLHLSQTGTAAALLLRSKALTDISDGLAPNNAEPYPLKTFVNVSSGRLYKDDKLIITTDGIYDIFSPEEIKKSALRFSDEDFVQFLKTALGNELEKAAVLVIDMREKDEPKEITAEKPKMDRQANVFSQAAFIKEPSAKNPPDELRSEIKKEIRNAKNEFVDEKTGHIYIKGDENINRRENIRTDYFEKLSRIPGEILKNNRKLIANLPSVATALMSVAKKTIVKSKPEAQKIFSRKNMAAAGTNIRKFSKVSVAMAGRVLPNFPKLRENASRLDHQQKIYVAIILLLIFVAPYYGLKIFNYMEAKKIGSNKPASQTAVAFPLDKDKNVIRIASTKVVYSGGNIQKVINLKGSFYAITDKAVISIAQNKSFAFPSDFGQPLQAAGMDSLNLIFIMDNNKNVISFSPVASSFQNNTIGIPSDADITGMGTYLTYLYLLDSKNNRIYRYPRVTGGFGTATNWYKGTASLAAASDLAMNESIYLADKNNAMKLFRGTDQGFAMESTATPVEVDRLAVGTQSGGLYILDNANSRIIRLDGQNQIIAQYYDMGLHDANSLAVDETNNLIYFSNAGNVQTFSMNQ